jgi:hypothetical protein
MLQLAASMRIDRRPVIVILAVFVGMAFGAAIAASRQNPFGVYLIDGRPAGTMDFAAIRAFTRAAWSGALTRDTTSAYTLAAYQRATELWLGMPDAFAQPCGYSPTMLWLMGPFSALPGRLAFWLWSFAGVAATTWMILRTRAPWPVLLALVTPLTLYTVALGQTALLTTAALFYLMTPGPADARGWHTDAKRGVVLWLLTAKPPLAVAAGTALLALRRRRVVLVALGLTGIGAIAVTPWLGSGWVRDYVGILTSYDRSRMPDAFGWAIVPEAMSNLRAALHSDLGVDDHLASRISIEAWLVALVGILALVRVRRTSEWATWSLSILAFLLFCPHVGGTEELALFLIPATMRLVPRRRVLEAVVIALVLGGLVLSPTTGPARARRPSALFFAQALLVVPVLLTVFTEGSRETAVATALPAGP